MTFIWLVDHGEFNYKSVIFDLLKKKKKKKRKEKDNKLTCSQPLTLMS